jgi:uncharacterized DUF497 family protein
MKPFDWSDERNAELRAERGIGFEDIVYHIARGDVLDIVEHPNRERYGAQRVFIVNVDGYAYLAPFVEDQAGIFLKTVIPSRKMTRRYLKEHDDEADKRGD